MTLLERDQNVILNTYTRLPIVISHAKDNRLYTTSGEAYIDLFSGIAVNNIGHCEADVIKAIHDQLDAYLHLSNYFVSKPVIELAETLIAHSFASKVFFTNSGTESVEAAIKLCRKYGASKNKTTLLAAHGAFHGRSTGALTLTGKDAYKTAFQPLMPEVAFFHYNDPLSLQEQVNEYTAAVFVEMVQGEGGLHSLSEAMVQTLMTLRDKYDFIIVVDEIQTGIGRTGRLFAYEHFSDLGFSPDVLCLSKALGGGLPLGAMLVSSALEDVLALGDHGTTFGGNPVAAAAGNALIQTVLKEGFLDNISAQGEHFKLQLEALRDAYPHFITAIRGRGYMLGIECGHHAKAFQTYAFERHLLINVTSQTVIRLLPSFSDQTPSDLNTFLMCFEDYLKTL